MSPVVLVTGCSTGGIGFALAEEYARRGCNVYASSRNVDTIGTFKHASISKLALDITDDESVNSAVQQIIRAEGAIDIVVNNAGVICPGALIDNSIDKVKQVFDTNIFSILRVCKAVIPIMAQRKTGVIVNIGSIVGEIATPWNGVYCASKAAVKSLSEVLHMECKPFNISVLHVAAGGTKSNLASNAASLFSLPSDSLYSAFLPNILQRLHASQGSNSMANDAFAREVVDKSLRKSPPRYITLGASSGLFSFFKWLPRGLVLYILWKVYSKKL